MHKKPILWSLLLFNSYLGGLEKLSLTCQVAYGKEDAPIKVTEYFSLSCPVCIEGFQKDFPTLKAKYIDSGQVFWSFHLHPADLLTLQAMVCLEKLSFQEKRIFFETFIEMMRKPAEGCFIMQVAMQTLDNPVPELSEIEYLKKSASFSNAFRYLSQPDVPKELPTIEINNVIYSEFPNQKFLEKKFSALIQGDRK